MQGRDLQPGDRVLIRNLTPRGGPGKIKSFWENQVYKVKERKGDNSPICQVSPENGNGRDGVVHQNLLLPCDHLPLEQPSIKTSQPQRDSQSPAKKKMGPHLKRLQQQGSVSNSDDDYEGTYQWHQDISRGDQRKKSSLNPHAEPFWSRQSRQHQSEEDVRLQHQSEEDLPLQHRSEEDLPLQLQRPVLASDSHSSEEGDTPDSDTDLLQVRQQPERLRQRPVVLSYDTLVQRDCK